MTSRVALVTGGTGGIGTAICQRLADQGHRVATNYRDEGKARTWQQAMAERGYSVSIFPGDVSDPTVPKHWYVQSRPNWARSRSWSTMPASPATPPSIACARTSGTM